MARRTLQALPVLVGVSIITFVLIYYLPADPARLALAPPQPLGLLSVPALTSAPGGFSPRLRP